MSAPQQNTTTSTAAAAVHPDDVNAWIGRFKDTINKPEIITKPTTGPNSWSSSFFGCFDPIDTCLITCCCPCVTFGKTHHRLRKSATLEGYSPVNATCLGFWLSGCVCLPWLFQSIQKAEVREHYNIKGEFPIDCLKSWCCLCCDLVQTDKEVAHQIAQGNIPVTKEVQPAQGMTYQAPH
jgi:Cys-rich protein (TIGR01571 family)